MNKYTWADTNVTTTHVGWVRHNGGGEIIFRQAVHPGNEIDLPALGWVKVYLKDNA